MVLRHSVEAGPGGPSAPCEAVISRRLRTTSLFGRFPGVHIPERRARERPYDSREGASLPIVQGDAIHRSGQVQVILRVFSCKLGVAPVKPRLR